MDKKPIECPLCRIGKYPHFSYSGSGACDHCGAVWTYDEGDTLTDDSLRRLWEKVPRWIPVEERLPVDIPHGYCLVTDGENVGTANCTTANKFDHCIDRDYWTPTHWMPLPEPPEVK